MLLSCSEMAETVNLGCSLNPSSLAEAQTLWECNYYSLSVDDLFEEINNRMSQNPAKAIIEYDKNYGFPIKGKF